MKKIIIVFLLSTVFLLSGCNKKEIDYETLYEEYYASVEYTPDEQIQLCDVGSLLSSHIEIDYINLYPEFSDMVESESGKFVYGEVYKTKDFNCLAKSVYLKVYDTEFTDERALIRISVPIESSFILEREYLLHLTFSESIDAYFLSQNYDSFFPIDSEGTISDSVFSSFFSENYPNNIEDFIDEVFE